MESGANHARIDWLDPRRFALALGVLVLAAFPQVVCGLQTFVYRDFGYFGYPIAHQLRESVWRGEVPLWNPLNECGLPFLAQWNTQVLYPPALFYLLFPLSWALGLFCLAHLFLGGLGMYFLADRWTGNRLAAAIAGVAFAFSGLALNSLIWPNNIAALGWMPWVVLSVEKAWREGGRNVIAAAVVGAMQMLAGAPEIILMTWLLLAALLVSEFFHRSSSVGALLFRFGLVILLVAGLSAAQLLPLLDLLKHSHRGTGFGTDAWALPATGWANFLVPLFHTHPASHGVFVQTGQYWTASYYVGVAIVALAVWAVWRVRERRVWVLAALGALFIVLALGDAGRLYPWLREHWSVLGLMRFPIKLVVLPVFAAPLLAAWAIARQETTGGWPKIQLGVLWLAVIGLMAVILWYAAKFPLPDDHWDATWRNAAARAAFFTAIFVALALSNKITRPRSQRLLHIALLGLVWLDLLTHAPLHKTVSRDVFDRSLPRELPAPQHGTSRAMVSAAARQKLSFSFLQNPAEDYVSRRWALFSDCNLLEDIPVLDGFYSLHLPEQLDVGALLYGNTNSAAPRLVEFLGVSQTTSATNFFEWEPRKNHLPLLTGGQKPIFADATTTLQRLASEDFDPRGEVFLPPEAKSLITATNAPRVKISDARFSAQRIAATVEADSRAMLVAAQSYYHDWKAYVDGQPTPLWRANHAFQALEVPAGKHQIALIYEDRAFHAGAAISLITLGVCAVGWRQSRKKGKP